MYDFKGQTVIITGGTRGIGKAIAESFLKAGAKVIVTYSTNEAAMTQFKQDNSQLAENIDIQKLDVSKYAEVEEFFKYIDTKYGSFEVLVNNAGIRKDSVLAMMKESDWHDVLNVNLTGIFYMCKFAIRNLMRKRYGRVINVSSVMERYAFEGQANYAAAKALEALPSIACRRGLLKLNSSRTFLANYAKLILTGFLQRGSDAPKR
jgi:3-oxoacyl-[acyl-carrier protein] reductase